MRPARLTGLLTALVVSAAACTGTGGSGGPAAGTPEAPRAVERSPRAERSPAARTRMERIACRLPPRWLVRIARGHHPERSAELVVLPEDPNFIGGGLPHVGPWDYTSRVPMLFYGPGFIQPAGRVDRPVTLADVAPTWGSLLGMDLATPDGAPITEALVPPSERPEAPRLLVTLVWDGAGRNVLRAWPDRWRNLRRLRAGGAWFEGATTGSSPTSSAQMHATIGTGAFPRTHGMTEHSLREAPGRVVQPWAKGPRHLLRPTLADLWLEEQGGRARVALIGTVAIQLGMLGHGAAWKDNPRPVIVLREQPGATTLGAEGVRWHVREELLPFYRFARYANSLRPLRTYFDEWDRRDGMADGTWRGHALDDELIEGGFQSPARIPYETRLVEEVIRRERLGRDEVPDLLFLNYKVIDQIGHLFSLNSEEMGDAVEAQDEALPRLIEVLDGEVGEGRWAMVVTADHGSRPDADLVGSFRISAEKLHAAIQERFDRDTDEVEVVDQIRQTDVFLNLEELGEHGASVEDVARFVMRLTQEDLFIPDLSAVTDASARVFRAAFPSAILPSLPCLPEDAGGP